MKIGDVFYRVDGETKYTGALWENKFADEQRSKGFEPWVDLQFSVKDGGKWVKATEIRFGDKVLKLGGDDGVYLKIGLSRGLTIASLEEADDVDVSGL